MNTYKTAWHCPVCRKLVVDTAGLDKIGQWPDLTTPTEKGEE